EAVPRLATASTWRGSRSGRPASRLSRDAPRIGGARARGKGRDYGPAQVSSTEHTGRSYPVTVTGSLRTTSADLSRCNVAKRPHATGSAGIPLAGLPHIGSPVHIRSKGASADIADGRPPGILCG